MCAENRGNSRKALGENSGFLSSTGNKQCVVFPRSIFNQGMRDQLPNVREIGNFSSYMSETKEQQDSNIAK